MEKQSSARTSFIKSQKSDKKFKSRVKKSAFQAFHKRIAIIPT